MTRFVLFSATGFSDTRGSILPKLSRSILIGILIVCCVCVAGPALAQHPVAVAHPGVHPAGGHVAGGMHPGAPPRTAIPAPRVFVGPRGSGPRFGGIGPRGIGFRQGPIRIFRRRPFFFPPFFAFAVGYNSYWWPGCSPSVGWAWGWGGAFNCYPSPSYGFGFENYVAPPTFENPVYLYGGEDRDLVWLYRKDGSVYGVTDYWFVNGQVHFTTIDQDPTKPAEHAIPYDDLDVQKTIYMNTHRGFRIVFRDEPWRQYLKDHPDLTPPDQPPS